MEHVTPASPSEGDSTEVPSNRGRTLLKIVVIAILFALAAGGGAEPLNLSIP